MMSEQARLTAETLTKYEQYVNPAMARLFRFMGLATLEWSAEGAVITDADGKEYLDCLGSYGVFSLGHRHPEVVAAVKAQIDRMPLSSKILLNKPMADLAELMAQVTPGDLQYSFFGNSGTEAVEGALKLARLHTGRQRIVATINSFHGKSLGALSATGRDLFRDPFLPLLDGFSHVPFNDVAAIANAVTAETAAVIVEPVQGEGGIIIPASGYLAAIRDICDRHGALLICDEVQTGLGRTGKMFACDHEGVVPDIITTAKALGGGVMPIGAFTARPQVWERLIDSPFLHTSTFGGSPVACAAAVETLKVLLRDKLAERSAILGEQLLSKLQTLAVQYPQVLAEVRGCGLMIGLELTKEGVGGMLMSELFNQGVLVAYTLNNPKVIRLEPPLIISSEQLEQAAAAVRNAVVAAQEVIEDL